MTAQMHHTRILPACGVLQFQRFLLGAGIHALVSAAGAPVWQHLLRASL